MSGDIEQCEDISSEMLNAPAFAPFISQSESSVCFLSGSSAAFKASVFNMHLVTVY